MAKQFKRAAIVAVTASRKRCNAVIHAADWRSDAALCGLRNYEIAEVLPTYATCKRCLAVLRAQTWWKPERESDAS